MKKVVILGSGAGGTMTAAKLRKELSDSEWQITIIDNELPETKEGIHPTRRRFCLR
jgi:NADH dehydrogenase FAD-containing subunit